MLLLEASIRENKDYLETLQYDIEECNGNNT
jgi:hypothetical protein